MLLLQIGMLFAIPILVNQARYWYGCRPLELARAT